MCNGSELYALGYLGCIGIVLYAMGSIVTELYAPFLTRLLLRLVCTRVLCPPLSLRAPCSPFLFVLKLMFHFTLLSTVAACF
jgi:hypothetical protein